MDANAKRLAAPKPKRRWFQFSLVTLLLLTLGCAVVLALWVAPAERQRRAVAFLKSLDGQVLYADDGEERASTPEWLRRILGKDYFTSVKAVDLSVPQVSDAELVHLRGLTTLEALFLTGTQVSDAGLVHLKGLRALEVLTLEGTQVGDAGLAHLTDLTALKELSLYDTQVSDAGLTHVVLGGGSGQYALYVVDAAGEGQNGQRLGMAKLLPVTLGASVGEMVAVEGDVAAGALVVVAGNERLRDGQEVTYRAPRSSAAGVALDDGDDAR